jgi:hypothetical protein
MERTATAASIPGTTEDYDLDWHWRKSHEAFFGDFEGRSRRISQDEAMQSGAEEGWQADDSGNPSIQAGRRQEVGRCLDGNVVVVGFEEVGGARRYTRRIKVTSKYREESKVRVVYDSDGN